MNKITKRLLLATCLAATSPGLSAAAMAQAAGAASAPASDAEIVVTSRKRNELAIEVPTSITVVGDAFIENSGARTVTDLGYGVTGLFLDSADGGSGATSVSIRGIAGLAEPTGVRSGVGFFVDGINIFNQKIFNIPLLDIQRVEVLKGPQPAAFGRSAVGGAINLITRKPPRELRVEGDFTYGNYDHKQARLVVGGPLSDKLSVSVAGLTQNHDGYLKNVFEKGLDAQSTDMIVGRASLLYQASEALTIELSQDYFRDDGFYGPRDCSNEDAGCAPGGAFDRRIKSANSRYRNTSAESVSGNARINYDTAGGGAVTAISAYRYNKYFSLFDITDTGAGSVFSDQRDNGSWEFSQELRYSSPDDDRFTYLGGLLYTHENFDFTIPFVMPADVPQPLFPELGADLVIDDRLVRKTNIYSAFASGNYALTDQLKLDVGARYTHEAGRARSIQFVVEDAGLGDAQAAALFDGIELFDVSRKKSWDLFEGQAALSYMPSDDTNIYARVSQGKKSGGFTHLIVFGISTIRDPGFDPETLIAYELGAKTALLDRRLQLAGALFYNDYDDIQARFRSAADNGIRIIQNAGAARSVGAEIELTARPSEQLSITAGMSYQESEYTQAVPLLGIADGNRLPNTPRFLANLAIDAEVPVNENVAWFGGVNAGYRTKNYHDSQNTHFQKAHLLANARTGLSFGDGRLTAALWVRNLTDVTVPTFQFDDPAKVLVNPPRTYGIEVGFRF